MTEAPDFFSHPSLRPMMECLPDWLLKMWIDKKEPTWEQQIHALLKEAGLQSKRKSLQAVIDRIVEALAGEVESVINDAADKISINNYDDDLETLSQLGDKVHRLLASKFNSVWGDSLFRSRFRAAWQSETGNMLDDEQLQAKLVEILPLLKCLSSSAWVTAEVRHIRGVSEAHKKQLDAYKEHLTRLRNSTSRLVVRAVRRALEAHGDRDFLRSTKRNRIIRIVLEVLEPEKKAEPLSDTTLNRYWSQAKPKR